ncbi:MAG: NUDIX domain-containing protein [Ilumatobacteraceae bacterium]
MAFEAIFPGFRPHVVEAGQRAAVVEGDALVALRESCTGSGPVGQLITWAWTVDPDRTHTLLVHHADFHHWMPGGGRCGADEHPADAALRELHEETGVRGRLLVEHPLLLDVVEHDHAGVAVRSFGMAFLVEADRSLPLMPEPDQPAAWFAIGPEPPDGASVRHWARVLHGLGRDTGAP